MYFKLISRTFRCNEVQIIQIKLQPKLTKSKCPPIWSAVTKQPLDGRSQMRIKSNSVKQWTVVAATFNAVGICRILTMQDLFLVEDEKFEIIATELRRRGWESADSKSDTALIWSNLVRYALFEHQLLIWSVFDHRRSSVLCKCFRLKLISAL